MEIRQETFNVEIEEWVEAKIWEHGFLKETLWIKGNTVTATGKGELAKLVGDKASNTIDTLWAKIDGSMTSDTSVNSRSNNTLSVATSSAYTVAGTYSGIFTGNNVLGDGSYYNSIAISIELTAGSEIDFTVKWVFTGAETGFWGDEVCASRLGKIGDDYDYPLSSVAIFWVGALQDVKAVGIGANNNTLVLTHAAFAGPNSFDNIQYTTSATDANRFFDKINGMTVDFDTDINIYTETEFVFG